MSDELQSSLLYLERTARRLLDGAHPHPHRAAHLMRFHAERALFCIRAEGLSND